MVAEVEDARRRGGLSVSAGIPRPLARTASGTSTRISTDSTAHVRVRRSTLEEDVAALLWRTTQFEVQLEELDRRKTRLHEIAKSQRVTSNAQQGEFEFEDAAWTRILVSRRSLYLTAILALLLVLFLGRFVLSL